jgi:catechol 2,3-dioxygenase-like lactoylglutathione lyase family enzyme
MLLSHVHVGISDFNRAFQFYSGVMERLGFVLKVSHPEKSWAAWMEEGVPRPLFLIGLPFDEQATNPGNGPMVAFFAPTRAAVDQCYAWATENGGTDEGPPGLRPHYHPQYYGAYFRDPDGNKICVCCHHPASGDALNREDDTLVTRPAMVRRRGRNGPTDESAIHSERTLGGRSPRVRLGSTVRVALVCSAPGGENHRRDRYASVLHLLGATLFNAE